ncbi:hypothetical protein O3P69_018852 [Scylla paramamosain]|uniref:Uncharacterized protein n=1 Tax=Scylla paramamosain TaxID=85552 RepID=A0AAW0SRY4_SCYPA
MARWAKPKSWDYALMACYSMKNQMKFLSMAVENILGEAGCSHPDPKSRASAAILQGEGLADIGLIREAMSKIQLENDIFERENEINKRLIRFDDKATSVPKREGKASNDKKAGGEWITLDLKLSFSRDLATFSKNVSPLNASYYNVEQHLEKDMANLES